MSEFYKITKGVIEETDLLGWAENMESEDRIVKQTFLDGGIKVSTVFLGKNHNWEYSGPLLLFETMIFGGSNDQFQDRCTTYNQAKMMHKRIVLALMCYHDLEDSVDESYGLLND